jgi:hypothetical protein
MLFLSFALACVREHRIESPLRRLYLSVPLRDDQTHMQRFLVLIRNSRQTRTHSSCSSTVDSSRRAEIEHQVWGLVACDVWPGEVYGMQHYDKREEQGGRMVSLVVWLADKA